MTQVTEVTRLQRQVLVEDREDHLAPQAVRTDGRLARIGAWFRLRGLSLAWFVPLLVLSTAVRLINLGGAPQRIDDEGTYTAQAFAIERLGELTHYTYWYDHPPLGWIQIAAWTGLTGAFDRYDVAVMAGREAMVVAHVITVALLWMLARRLGFGRPSAAAVLLVFALSPLALQFQRTVFLDNVATPWLLAAFVLVLNRHKQLAAFAAAAVCFAIAVLTKETYLLMLPFLAWTMWRNADQGTRRYTVSLSAGLVVLLGMSYALLAVIKGELVPGTDRVSLWSGIAFQLASRDDSGSVFDGASQAAVTTGQWIQLDPVLVMVAPVAAVICLLDKRMRPLAAALVFLVLFMLRPGYLPIPYVIVMLPLAALVVVGAVRIVVGAVRRASGGRRVPAVVAGAVVSGLLVAVAAPMWGPQLRGLLLADLDQPTRQAQAWVEDNVDRDYRLVVDNAMWVDLYEAGFDRDDVVWYYKVDTDPAVQALASNGWQDYDYVITTDSLRTFPDGFPIVGEALDNSVVVARFGEGERAVEINRVERQGLEAAQEQEGQDQAARVSAGTELSQNPMIQAPQATRDLLTGGQVDARAIIGTGLATRLGALTLADAPAVPGEEDTDVSRRQVLISELDGAPLASSPEAVSQLSDLLSAQSAPYAPRSIQTTDQGLLVTWNVDAPDGLLGAG